MKRVSEPGTRINNGSGIPEGNVSAKIDGKPWRADASIQVAYHQGILAIAGCDRSGSRIGLALLAETPGTPQPIGVSPANALVSIGRWTWVANDSTGEGTVTLTTFTPNRVIGTFDFVGVSCEGREPIEQAVLDGRFDVWLGI